MARTASVDERRARGSRTTIGTSSRALLVVEQAHRSGRRRPAARRTRPRRPTGPRRRPSPGRPRGGPSAAGCSTYQSMSTTPARLGRTSASPAAAIASAPGLVRPVDLGHQRLEHRRARRHLGHLDRARRTSSRPARARRAPAWRCRGSGPTARSFGDEVHLQVGLVGQPPHEVVAHEAVEVVGRGGARRTPGRSVTVGLPRASRGPARPRRARSARAASPRAVLMMTWNSLLLSNGSILTLTRPSGTSATEASSRTPTAAEEREPHAAAARSAGPSRGGRGP